MLKYAMRIGKLVLPVSIGWQKVCQEK